MSHEIAVRDMQIKDIHEYSQMLVDMVEEFPKHFSISPVAAAAYSKNEFFNPRMQAELNNNPGSRFVAVDEADGKAVGVVITNPAESSLEIYNLFVRPHRRGLGLGVLLLKACEAYAIKTGFDTTALVVSNVNEGALRLYERNGYVQDESVAPQPIAIHPGLFGLTFKKMLTES